MVIATADAKPVLRAAPASPRVLFVSHEATRTGAPIMFLHFLRWLRENTDLDFEILLLAGGPLTEEFAAVAPLTHVEALGASPRSYLEAGLAKAGLPGVGDRLKVSRSRRAVEHLRGFDALYLNSTTSAMALRILPEIPPVVMSHIHELDSAFRYWFPENHRRAMLQHTDRFITCAEGVSNHLIGQWRVPVEDIACHHEFIDPPAPSPGAAARVRRELDIPADAAVVGASGTVCWRKGPDLFVEVAATVRRRRPDLDVHFVWLGGTNNEKMPVEVDMQRLNVADRVHFVDECADPADIFAAFDVFALPSREDPYPLVMLETAALAIPMVSFANGGAVEFAGVDPSVEPRAVIVDYLDVGAMADALIALIEDPEQRRALGRRAQQRVLEQHSIEVAAPALFDELVATTSGITLTSAPDPSRTWDETATDLDPIVVGSATILNLTAPSPSSVLGAAAPGPAMPGAVETTTLEAGPGTEPPAMAGAGDDSR